MPDVLRSIDTQVLHDRMKRVVRRTRDMDFTWDWPCGVAFYGITQAWKTLQNDDDIEYLVAWVNRYIDIGIPPFVVNTISMGHTLIALYEITGERKLLDLAVKKAEYLMTDAPRIGDGVFQHTVSENVELPGQVWADTLFMAAYFLLRLGCLLDRDVYINEALYQFTAHEELLQDPSTNLFYHGYDDGTRGHMSGVYWGRTNAWAAYTMSVAKGYINYLYPEFMAIDGALRDQLSALVRLQGRDGLWHTVLDDSTTYGEVSASAGIAAALVANRHPLHRDAVVRAYDAIADHIDEDGSVRSVSAGTGVMDTPDDYNRVPRKRIQGWGQGLVLAFLSSLAEGPSRSAL